MLFPFQDGLDDGAESPVPQSLLLPPCIVDMTECKSDTEHLDGRNINLVMYPQGEPFDDFDYFKRQAVIMAQTYSSQNSLMKNWDLYSRQRFTETGTKPRSFWTLWRELLEELPNYSQFIVLQDKESGEKIEMKHKVFPRSKYNSDKYKILRLDCRADFKALQTYFVSLHPAKKDELEEKINNKTLKYDIFIDGVEHSVSTKKKMLCQVVRFEGCEHLYNLCTMIVLDPDEEKLTAQDQLAPLLEAVKKTDCKPELVIADMPQRQALLEIVNFNGKYGCKDCIAEGEVAPNQVNVIWPYSTTEEPLRDNDHWRKHALIAIKQSGQPEDGLGLRGYSPLLKIPGFKIDEQVPNDPMHMLYMGMCKLLYTLVRDIRPGAQDLTERNKAYQEGIAEAINKCFVGIEFPSEIDRLPRAVDAARFKSNEWKILVFVSGWRIADNFFKRGFKQYAELWYTFTFVLRAFAMPNEWYADVCEKYNLQDLILHFYKLFEDNFGQANCKPNLHGFAHFKLWRDKHRLKKMSAEPAESFYGHNKKWHNARTRHGAKSIHILSCMAKMGDHKCVRGFKYSKYKETNSRNDSIILTKRGHFYRFLRNNHNGTYRAQRVITYKYWPKGSQLDWSLVGVFMFGGVYNNDFCDLKPEDCKGKGILVGENIVSFTYDMWKS